MGDGVERDQDIREQYEGDYDASLAERRYPTRCN